MNFWKHEQIKRLGIRRSTKQKLVGYIYSYSCDNHGNDVVKWEKCFWRARESVYPMWRSSGTLLRFIIARPIKDKAFYDKEVLIGTRSFNNKLLAPRLEIFNYWHLIGLTMQQLNCRAAGVGGCINKVWPPRKQPGSLHRKLTGINGTGSKSGSMRIVTTCK